MTVDPNSVLLGRLATLEATGDRWLWRIPCLVLAVLLPAVVGLAFEWDPQFAVIGSVALGIATFMARSLARAVYCLLAVLGLFAGVLAILLAFGDGVPAELGFRWAWVAYAVWVTVPLLATLWRRVGLEAHYGAVEVVGGVAAILIALVVMRRVDFAADLLPLLIQFEDNEAWVGLVTQIETSSSLGPGLSVFGPLIGLIVGLLRHWQADAQTPYNAVYAAYMLACVIAPIVIAGLLRAGRAPAWIAGALAAGVVLWGLQVPFALYLTAGHLTASWAFVLLVAAISCVATDRCVGWGAPVAAGLLLGLGMIWFPLAPLAAIGLVALVLRSALSERAAVRVVTVVVFGGAFVIVAYHLAFDTLGLGSSSGVSGASAVLSGLYAAKGGTASLDGVIQIAVLAGVAGLAFVRPEVLGAGNRLWRIGALCLVYVAAVFVGSHILRVAISYGPTKVWYVVGFAVAVVLMAVVVHVKLGPREASGVIIALLVGSLFYGGTGTLVSRTWIGQPVSTPWLSGLQTYLGSAAAQDSRPIACVSADDFQAYLCTRWAGGLSAAGGGAFDDYRLRVISGSGQAEEVAALRDNGTLAKSTVFIVDDPGPDRPWAWEMIRDADSVIDVNGGLLEDRPTESSIPGAE